MCKTRHYLMLTALFCASLFTACSDDDEENPDDLPGTGGGDVTVLEKKVTRIVESDADGTVNTTRFTYDDAGRLTQITTVGSESEIITITHTDEAITMSYAENTNQPAFFVTTLNLEGGKVRSASYEDTGYDDSWNNEYTYEGDYLNRVDCIYSEDSRDTVELTVSDGNLTHVLTRGLYESTITPSEVANNANLDLFGYLFLYDEFDAEPYYFDVCGERFKMMPERIYSHDFGGDGDYTLNISYTVDEEGYVTRVSCTEGEAGDTYEYWYNITYEE